MSRTLQAPETVQEPTSPLGEPVRKEHGDILDATRRGLEAGGALLSLSLSKSTTDRETRGKVREGTTTWRSLAAEYFVAGL